MRAFFNHIAKQKNSFFGKGLFCGALLAFVVYIIFPAEAAAFVPSLPEVDLGKNDTLKGVAEFAAMLIHILTFLSLFILSLVGDLVGTEFITGDEAMSALRPMWIFVRNLVNIGFVLALVYLAFSNLFASFGGDGAPASLWKIKEKLPKIIMAIVAVNFSLLGFRLMIDAVHVGTTAIFGIADVQLEARSATSVDRVLKNKTWTVISTPENVGDGKKYVQLAPPDGKEFAFGDVCNDFYDDESKTGGIGKWGENNDKDQIPFLVKYKDSTEKKYKDKVLACTSFLTSINDSFCSGGDTDDSKCFFKFKEDLSQSTFISSSDDTAQNLFMSFGVNFMRLERLPMLAANIDDIVQVIDNTLFSVILAAAYVIVLVAFFIVLVLRVIILWLGLVLSPVIVAGSIMGLGTDSLTGEIKFMTMLIVPLKVAAAFAISFVMLSGMIEFRPDGREGIFEFGAALSNLAIDEYALLWQILTIVVFWKAARWAIKDTDADSITNGLFDGAEKIGGFLARSATTEAQIFTAKDKNGENVQVGLQSYLDIPMGKIANMEYKKEENRRKFLESQGAVRYNVENSISDDIKSLKAPKSYVRGPEGDLTMLKDLAATAESFEAIMSDKAGKDEFLKRIAAREFSPQATVAAANLQKTFNKANFETLYAAVGGEGAIKYKGAGSISGDTISTTGIKSGSITTQKDEATKTTNVNATKNDGTAVTFNVSNMVNTNIDAQTRKDDTSKNFNAYLSASSINAETQEVEETSKDLFTQIFANHTNPAEILEQIDSPNNQLSQPVKKMFRGLVKDSYDNDEGVGKYIKEKQASATPENPYDIG